MRILFFAQYFPPDVGGASTRAYNAALGLTKNGCNVTILTSLPHYPKGKISKKYSGKFFVKEEINGIKVIRTWIPNLAHSSNIKRIILHLSFSFFSIFGLFSVEKPDIIFAMNPNIFSFFPANFASKIFGKPIIRNVDDLWPEVFYELGIVKSSLAKRILNYITKITYQVPCAIIPVSEGYVNTIIKKYNVPPNKIHVIPHGVDEDFLKQQDEVTTNPKKILMYSGAINSGYNFELILKSAQILQKKNIQFIIRGFGDSVEKIQKIVKDLQLDNVLINTDFLDKQNLISYMNKADIFLLPLNIGGVIDKGLPTKIFEYQSLAKPILCLSNGESGNYIKKTNSGIVTDTTDPKIVSNMIVDLLNDESLCHELGKNGLKNVEKTLTIDKTGKKLLSVIKNYIK